MRFFSVILPVALLASPIFATPVERAGDTVRCKVTDTTDPKKHKDKTFTVSVETAKEQMKVAGLKEGTSSYPHSFGNHGEPKLQFPEGACSKKSVDLVEYPVFWERHDAFEKDTKVKKQAVSPIRVVYANSGGAPIYCGIMTHVDANNKGKVDGDESWQGTGGFKLCT